MDLAAQETQNAEIVARLESFEKAVVTLLSDKNKQDSASTNTDNTSTCTNTSVSNTDSSSSNARNDNNTASSLSKQASTSPNASSKATPSPLNPSSSSSSFSSSSTSYIPYKSLKVKVNQIREQTNAAALDLSDKIDNLKEENQAFKAHIIALETQLAEEKSKADSTYNIMANRIGMLERYVQNDTKLEDQKKREIQEVQLSSQKNTDLINKRITTVEEQLTRSFQEFEDRRSKEMQSFSVTFKSLKKRYNDLKIELDQQAELTAIQGKEITANAATIKQTLSSDALTSLGKIVRDAMCFCEGMSNQLEAERKALQGAMESTSEDLKMLKERIVDLETEFDDMRQEARNDLAKMEGKIMSMAQDTVDIAQEMGTHYNVLGLDGKPIQQAARDVTEEAF
ncbi:hypothetical protein HMPREF1544_07112 [Mucor circinelloides 1006PhL]|uniref:Uncharacterized protein n=1 Tax=Mucor circinelloides f. circinelloides (strain 1006PhL) TaxID=1220926 RepID=S2J900_MUCC1|nr:hypothetical protein HMPREF1544_07112 [Mucor circinelloides 1006PhL]